MTGEQVGEVMMPAELRNSPMPYSGSSATWPVGTGEFWVAGGVSSPWRVESRGSHWSIMAVNAWAIAPSNSVPDFSSMYAITFSAGHGER